MSVAGILAAFKTLGFSPAVIVAAAVRCGSTESPHRTLPHAISIPYTKGVSQMHAAARNLRGGGIS